MDKKRAAVIFLLLGTLGYTVLCGVVFVQIKGEVFTNSPEENRVLFAYLAFMFFPGPALAAMFYFIGRNRGDGNPMFLFPLLDVNPAWDVAMIEILIMVIIAIGFLIWLRSQKK